MCCCNWWGFIQVRSLFKRSSPFLIWYVSCNRKGLGNLMFLLWSALLGGSFVFLDAGPSILFLVFLLFWVLWEFYGWQGFITICDSTKLLQFCLRYLEDGGGEIIGTLFWMWVIPVSAQVYCCFIIGAHYDLRVPYTTQFPSHQSRIFCLGQGHEMQFGPWVVMHGSAFPYTLPTNPPWKMDGVWIGNNFCFIPVTQWIQPATYISLPSFCQVPHLDTYSRKS